MYLKHLSLTNFRNFARLDLQVPRQSVLLTGDNAQGKTSLLEAIYFLATFASFQTHSDRQLVNFVASRQAGAFAKITAEYQRGVTSHKLDVRLILDPVGANSQRLRKEVRLDGVRRPVNEAIGHFNAVLFVPQMSLIIEGGPDERRRYLNLTLAQVFPGYASALSEYSKALEQRNALLKMLSERAGDPGQLNIWDETLAGHGARLIHCRIAALHELGLLAARIHHRLTQGSEALRLAYEPAFDPAPKPAGQISLPLDAPVDRTGLDLEDIRQGFVARLNALHQEEIARGVTTTGPHRDDLRFLANSIDLGDYGSRGQVRTALLSVKLAEVEWMNARTGQTPVILLDEVMAELDLQRRADLLAAVEQTEQCLLSTTDLKLFDPGFVSRSAKWQIARGEVREVE